LFDLTVAELAGVQVIDVQNPDNGAYGGEYLSHLTPGPLARDGVRPLGAGRTFLVEPVGFSGRLTL
jgi:hypothetical protein